MERLDTAPDDLSGDAYLTMPPPPPPQPGKQEAAFSNASGCRHRRDVKKTLSDLAGVNVDDIAQSRLQQSDRTRRNKPRLLFRPMHAIAAMMLLIATLCASLTMLIRQASNYAMPTPVTETSAVAVDDGPEEKTQDASGDTPAENTEEEHVSSDGNESSQPNAQPSEEATASSPSASPGVTASGGVTAQPQQINLNTASAAELDTIKGIGPVIAQRIIDHRTAIGRFVSVEQLLDVKGIGEKTLDKMRAQVTVQ